MAYTEADRVLIRRYIGAAAIFQQAYPLVEQAITATQSQADDGSRPDSSSENEIKMLIYGQAAVAGSAGITPGGTAQPTSGVAQPALRGLQAIEFQLAQMDIYLGTTSVGKGSVVADAYRETFRLRSEGQRLCKRLAMALGMKKPLSKFFFPGTDPEPDAGEGVFRYSDYW